MSEKCGKPATTLVHWPGHEPMPMCDDHAKDADRIADAMGFYIFTPEIEEDAPCASAVGRVQTVKV